jgi:hypothetical protein
MVAEPVAVDDHGEEAVPRAVGGTGAAAQGGRPVPKQSGGRGQRRSLPPN